MEKLILLFLGACVGASIALIIDCIRDVKNNNKVADNAIKQINELDDAWKKRCNTLNDFWISQYTKVCKENEKLFSEISILLEKNLKLAAQKEFIDVADVKKAKAEEITYKEF